jgi:anti-anti-sigma factor
MEIKTYEVQGHVTVTVLEPQGDVDGSTYRELIARAQEAYSSGAREMVIDLESVRFLSSSGLVAIHSIARLLQAREMPDLDGGWSALHSLEHDLSAKQGPHPYLKLASPQPTVEKVLQTTGFARAFEIHSGVEAAVASF